MIIEQPVDFIRWLYPKAIWRMDPTEKAIYLTFDDGPIPEATPFILDCLDKYNIKATFFMVGDNARKHPELLEEVRRRGHRIGNHTFNHISGLKYRGKNYLKNAQQANELLKTDLFRPPHGWMRTWQYHKIHTRGYRIIMWDVVTRDYSHYLNSDDVFNNVKRYTRPGSIITFHDSLRSIEKLKEALPRSIEWLKNEGYDFKVF